MTAPGHDASAVPSVSHSGASVGELVGEVSRDLSLLMRQELELAKAELKQEMTKTAKAAGMFGGAGFAGYMVLLFASVALWWALSLAVNRAVAAVIVAVIWAIIGAVLYSVGRRQMREVHPKPERTTETLQEIPGALKGR